ncbi:MAG: two-component regulator propeller domain-containing protein [Flavobacteriaceae bacterium]|nr:two-component regulator propeller domain-containing protein [Flavobacteriaceae bacterium]
MKTHLFIITFVLAFVPSSWSQNYDTSWIGHFSYLDIKEVVYGEAKFYAASENAIFSYDPLTNELSTITTINGLSGELISTIYYSNQYELLLIGYENGLIEIYNELNQELLKVIDIVAKTTIPSSQKKINHFNETDEVVFIATDYGISVYNLNDLEFGDTYYIGTNGSQIKVNQTAVYNNEIYAACGSNEGIKKASLSDPNLINFQFWTTLITGTFTNITPLGTQLYTVNSNNRIFEISGTNLNPLFVYPQAVTELKVSDNSLLVTTLLKVYEYSEGFNLASVYSTNLEFETNFTSALSIDGVIYIGTTDYGVLKSQATSVSVYDEIHPQGPLLNSAFSIEYGYNDLWVTFGAYTTSFNPYPLNKRGISRLRNTEWHNISYDSIQRTIESDVYVLNEISINPLDPNHVFVSSFHSGLLDVKIEESIELLDQSNSGLESIASNVTVRVSGTAFDNDANLWVLNSIIQKPLKRYNPTTNQWTSYDFSSIISDPMSDENGFSELVIGPDGTKWIGGLKKGLIGFNENGTVLKNINDEDIANLPSTAVKALALDKNNVLWIGTYKGLRVLYNTSSFFTEEVVRTEPIIILEDGLPQELLAQQFITDIIVDGSNNKWISTADAGVFYVSSDGQNTIHHFTKDNSPLPSNGVNDMALDSENGVVYFGTTRGLVAFTTGGSRTMETLEDIYVYPNPVRPGFNMEEDKIKIKNISENVNIKITDIEGNLVAEAQSNVNLRYKNYNLEIDGGTAYWNGKNLANNTVASGVYLVLFFDFDTLETKVSKIMIIR